MQVSVLASSSSGNSTYIETKNHKILVDAGLSRKKLAELMQSIDRNLEDLDTIFITHEHSDHIQGLGVLMRQLDVNVYANAKTWDAITSKNSMGEIPTDKIQILEANQTLSLDDVDIESYHVSHDAIDPQFYQFSSDNKRFTILTDTGYVSEKLEAKISNSDAYLLEFNHDMDMLREGPYSWALKQRIIGDSGHLSNDLGAQSLIDIVGRHTKKVYLGHLSPHNNTKMMAYNAALDACVQKEPEVDSDFDIQNTDPKSAQPLFKI